MLHINSYHRPPPQPPPPPPWLKLVADSLAERKKENVASAAAAAEQSAVSYVFVVYSLENLRSHIDLHTHAGSAFNNRVTLTFDFLTSGSTHSERPRCTVCLPNLALIAQAFAKFSVHADCDRGSVLFL